MLHCPSGFQPTSVSSPVQSPSPVRGKGRSPKVGSSTRQDNKTPDVWKRISKLERDRLILDYLEKLGTPRALTVWLLYKHGWQDSSCHSQLVKLTIDPHEYENAQRFRKDYAATKFLSKVPGLNTGIDTKREAIVTAIEAESICRTTNKRLTDVLSDPGVNPALAHLLLEARAVVSRVLGPCPERFEDVGWSRGRTSSAFGEELASVYKYASRPDVTWSARMSALRMFEDSPLWGQSVLEADGPTSLLSRGLRVVKGNTLITVPKNAKVDRVICYEPHMNIRLQLQAGRYIRDRLAKSGVSLDDQSVNQRRCRVASKYGHLATIDLSMASDTLSIATVSALLEPEWFEKLDTLRSKYTYWPDSVWRKNQKFSSMGNGFTFELESLIFYAVASAITSGVSVFGDDIIVPTSSYPAVRQALEAVGFRINASKSYATSHFRESCGADMFRGVDCTPVYLRVLPKTRGDVVKLHNAVYAWCARDLAPPLRFAAMLYAWRTSHTCYSGPAGFGDGHYHVDFQDAEWCKPCNTAFNGWIEGWWFRTYIPTYRENTLYGDRVSGHIPGRFGPAAILAVTGPKRVRSIFDSTVDRRQCRYKKHRAVANVWPSITWFSTN